MTKKAQLALQQEQCRHIGQALASLPSEVKTDAKQQRISGLSSRSAKACAEAVASLRAAKLALEAEKADAARHITQLTYEIDAMTKSVFMPARGSSASIDTVDDPVCAFDLHGVVVHVGPSHQSGHYVSYGRCRCAGGQEPEQWFQYNDATVRLATMDDVMSDDTARNVYCLFYTRRSESSNTSPFSVGVEVPEKIRRLVDTEDMRRQLRVAQRMSAEVS